MKKKGKSSLDKDKQPIDILLLKISIICFFAVMFICSFFFFDGTKVFESSIYVSAFAGYEFQVHTIDVENGDAILLRLPQNQTMLIDCGEEQYSDRVVSYINQYMKAEGLSKIDYFVLTHPDSDHCGGAKRVFEAFQVENLYRPTIYSEEEATTLESLENYDISENTYYNSAITSAYDEGCDIHFSKRGLEINLPNCKIEFLSPSKSVFDEDNDYSAVIMVQYYERKFLFMGDASTSIEKEMIAYYGENLQADVLKVGHHGSKTSTSQEFLDVVKPKYGLICASESSTVHPNAEVTTRLKDSGCQLLSTASLGNFALTVEANQVRFEIQHDIFNIWGILLAVGLVLSLILLKLPFATNKKPKLQQKT